MIKTKITINIILVILYLFLCFRLDLQHEQVHINVNKEYGLESKLNIEFNQITTTTKGNLTKDEIRDLKQLHTLNEITYPYIDFMKILLAIIFLLISIILWFII